MRERAGNTSRLGKLWLAAAASVLLCACTTVPVDPPQRGPVQTRPTGPVVQPPGPAKTPTETDTPTEPDDDEETRDRDDVAEPAPIDGTFGGDVPDAAQPYFNNRQGLSLPHMAGRDTKRLALLLPFSSSSAGLREQANSMFRAAELAVFERDQADTVLIALDTKGTDAGARSATRAALSQGADVILGPIIAGNVKAASREARRSGTPVIAFSNDMNVADRGTYLLSFPPEAEVERVVSLAASEGATRFAYLGPDGAYGRRVRAAYERAVAAVGGQITASETYSGDDISVMQDPARRLAQAYRDAEIRARANGGLTPRAFEAILMPEGGTALRSLAPLLPFNGVDPRDVQFMGTSRWDDPDAAREPALDGGIFASADKDARAAFLSNYERAFGEEPSSLASLAHDAVRLGTFIADGDPEGREARATGLEGFYGTDGFVRFSRSGEPERGLAVYRIMGGSFRVLDPAPTGAAPEG